MKLRAVVSSLLLLVFVFLAFSGALLYFGKTGMVMGMPRHILRGAHFWAAMLICALAALHLTINRRMYAGELKSLLKGRAGNAKHEERK